MNGETKKYQKYTDKNLIDLLKAERHAAFITININRDNNCFIDKAKGKIADAFNVDKDWLFDWNGPKRRVHWHIETFDRVISRRKINDRGNFIGGDPLRPFGFGLLHKDNNTWCDLCGERIRFYYLIGKNEDNTFKLGNCCFRFPFSEHTNYSSSFCQILMGLLKNTILAITDAYNEGLKISIRVKFYKLREPVKVEKKRYLTEEEALAILAGELKEEEIEDVY